MAERPLALYTDPAGSDPGPGIGLLADAGFDVRVHELTDPGELVELVAELQPTALLVSYLPIGEAVFRAAPSIRIVSCSAVGFNGVDLAAAQQAGVWVTNVPDAATEEVASHAFAMALALVRHLPFLDRHVRDGGWDYAATGLPRRLSEMTLGVIGMGRIGRCLAIMGTGVFARVIGSDQAVNGTPWPDRVERVELSQCLADSDVISLHVPLSDSTRRMIDAGVLRTVRPGTFLVNVSRGGLVDPGALLDALDGGRLGGVALDVTEPEPPSGDDPFRRHPRVLVTPHAAFLSRSAADAYVVRQAENVIAWLDRGRPNTAVNAADVPVG